MSDKDEGPIVNLRRFDPELRQTVFEPLPDQSAAVVEPPREGPEIPSAEQVAYVRKNPGAYRTHATIIQLCDAITALRSALSAALQDSERLDWLESHGELSIYFIRGGQFNPASQSLRAAIDGQLAALRSPSTDGSST